MEEKTIADNPGEEFLDSLARCLSFCLHPMLIGPFSFLIFILYLDLDGKHLYQAFSLAVLATVIIPAITIGWMVKTRRSVHIDIPEKEKRTLPLVIAILTYFLVALIYKILSFPILLSSLMLIYGINTLIATFITWKWKISIHAMSVGGPVAAFYFLFGKIALLGWFLLPVILFARLRLKAHTGLQVLVGFTLAFIMTLIQLKIYTQV